MKMKKLAAVLAFVMAVSGPAELVSAAETGGVETVLENQESAGVNDFSDQEEVNDDITLEDEGTQKGIPETAETMETEIPEDNSEEKRYYRAEGDFDQWKSSESKNQGSERNCQNQEDHCE